jgi:glycine cleavage system transcriptional repressor
MEYLAITLLGADRSNHLSELFKLTAHCGCHVLHSRTVSYGSEFSAQLFLSGTWNAIAKLEASLAAFENKQDLKCFSIRTQEKIKSTDQLPYFAYITAIEDEKVIHKITQFLQEQQIKIHDMSVNSYPSPINAIPMLSIAVSFTIPTNRLISDFRESFIIFCDDHNFDTMIEPQKNSMQIY